MIRWKRWWPEISGAMPMDFLPCSNGEYPPELPTKEQKLLMRLQDEEGERLRRRLGMTRRDFVRSAGAYAVGLWAIQQLALGHDRAYADHTTGAECTLHYPEAQLNNLPGEFIFDVQNHHVDDEDQLWRAANPVFDAFALATFAQARCGDPNHMDCFGRFHYIKEVFVDSSTNVGVLSGIPPNLDRYPLPPTVAAETAQAANGFAGSQRCLFQPFIFPNRGYAGRFLGGDGKASGLEDELEKMGALKAQYGDLLRGWKVYTPYGEVPGSSGFAHDDPEGIAMIERAIDIGVPLIASHKGLSNPVFDPRTGTCRDIGVVGRAYPDVTFVVYHSGFDLETVGPYPGDSVADSSKQGVDGLIKALRENQWSAREFASGTDRHANSPNVFAELGAVWRNVMNRMDPVGGNRSERIQAAHLLGKLIYYVGPKRVVWGTDSLWHGSPQAQIVAMRTFPLPAEAEARRILAEDYFLPYGLDGDVEDPSVSALDPESYHPRNNRRGPDWPTDRRAHPERSIRNGILGRNAAPVYGVDPDVQHGFISCDEIQQVRNGTVLAAGTERETRPTASNVVHGYRTRRDFLGSIWPNRPWRP